MKPKKIKPLFTSLITTMDCYDAPVINDAGIIDTTKPKGAIKEFQTVIEVGDTVRECKKGDIVCINPARYAVRKYQENSIQNDLSEVNPVTKFVFKTIELADEGECLLLDIRDILYIVEEMDEKA